MPVNFATLGIAMCVISYGKEASFGGKYASASITVTPKAVGVGQLRLTWAATGDIFSSFTDSTIADSGTPGIINLPQTGQTGFKHGSVTFQDWYYEAVVTSLLDDGQALSRVYRFSIPSGQTTLDLDTLDEDGVVTALPSQGSYSNEPAGLSDATKASLGITYATKTDLARVSSNAVDRGTNLSGLEFGDTLPGLGGTNYFTPVEDDFRYFAGKGFTVLRLPFRWERLQPYLNGALNATYKGYLDQAIGYARKYGVKLVLDCHNFSQRYISYTGGFTNDFTSSAGSWSGGNLNAGGYYESDPNTYFSTYSGGDSRNGASQNFVATLTLDAQIAPYPGVSILMLDDGNGTNYQFTFNVNNNQFFWGKNIAGTFTQAGSQAATLSLAHGYAVEIDVNQKTAGKVTVTVDGTQICQFPTDSAITGGKVSIQQGYMKSHIDNVTLNVAGNTTGGNSSGVYKMGTTQLPHSALADLWTKLSTLYKDEPAVWAYDVMNEPFGLAVPLSPTTYKTTATVTAMNQAAMDAIRAVDTQKWILIEGDGFAGLQSFTSQYGTNPDPWWNDPSGKTMVSFHYYFNSDHSGAYTDSWSQALRDRLPTDVLPAFQWAKAKNVPVFMGEYGVPNTTDTSGTNWRADLDTFLTWMDQYGIYGTHWAAGANYTGPATTLQPLNSYTTDVAQMPVVQKHLPASSTKSDIAAVAATVPTLLAVTTAPLISGTATVGSVLTLTPTVWAATPDLRMIQWKRAGTPISGATSTTYTLVSADAGQAITVSELAVAGGRLPTTTTSNAITPPVPLNSGAALTAYNSAAQIQETWTNSSAWTKPGTDPSQVSSGLLYGTTAPNPSGIYRALPGGGTSLGSSDRLTTTTTLVVPSAGPGGYMMASGFNTDTDSASYSGNFIGLGINASGTTGVVLYNTGTTTQISSDTLPAGTYRLTMTIDDVSISWSLTNADHSKEYTATIARSGVTITRLSLWVADNRGLSGSAFGQYAAKLALSPTKPRLTVEQVADSVLRSTGTVSAGATRHRVALPANYDPSVGAPLVMFFHPYSGDEMTPWTESNPRGVANALTAAGFIVAASVGSSQNDWGLQNKLDADYNLWQYLYNRYAILKTAFYSESMGGLSGLLSVAANQIPAVAWVGSMAVCNLRAEYDGAYNSAIQFAYGLASDGSDYNTKTAGHDPALLSGSAFHGIPMRFYASPSDTNVPKTSNADVIYAKVSGNANTSNIAVTGGHTDPSGFPATDIRDWLLARTA